MSVDILHDHTPIFRVVRQGWPDPLEVKFSQLPTVDNRWNTSDFPGLYCCCSTAVARAIVRDIFRIASVDIEDLQVDVRPQLVEIDWSGTVVDMTSEQAILANGFMADYPVNVPHTQTRPTALSWYLEGAEGILCRSASLARLGYKSWSGDHKPWSELVIFTENSAVRPTVRLRHPGMNWLTSPPS